MTSSVTFGSRPSPAVAYEEYFGPAIFGPLAELVLPHAALTRGEAVLDVACGTGIVARKAAGPVGPGGRIVGVDVNAGMLEVAAARASDQGLTIGWRLDDATTLDLPDASFDVVLCEQGLQFFADRVAGARQMRRVLGDGGRAVVATWQGPERHPLSAALAEIEMPYLERLGVPVTYQQAVAPFSLGDPAELRSILTAAGFGAVELSEASLVARLGPPRHFVERMEYAYAAVVPQFVEDPEAFAAYVEAVGRDVQVLLAPYLEAGEVALPMHTNIAVARP